MGSMTHLNSVVPDRERGMVRFGPDGDRLSLADRPSND